MSYHSSYDENVCDDVAQNNKSADKCYPIRLGVTLTSFLTQSFSPDAPYLSKAMQPNTQ
jgi:hypothetical protein